MNVNDFLAGSENLNHAEVQRILNESLKQYQNKFSEQFHLKIPGGVVTKIDYYRDTYFSYLKDSVYKSNLCYLMQLVDFLLWIYKLFKPGLSLENSYFYQLQITMGIVIEALATALLLNPIIKSDADDRSKGQVSNEYEYLRRATLKSSFKNNIDYLAKLGIINDTIKSDYHKFRSEIRNSVHIQNWEGRLYSNLTVEHFQNKIKAFRNLLRDIKEKVQMIHSAEDLRDIFYSAEEGYITGVITEFNYRKRFGFIKYDKNKPDAFFYQNAFSKKIPQEKLIQKKVVFQLMNHPKGPRAVDISFLEEEHDLISPES